MQTANLFEISALKKALSEALQNPITQATYQMEELQGGTVASVHLISGLATTANGNQVPYKIVLKIQKKWDRFRDPLSWRREYDLYRSELPKFFTNDFRWPHCYLAEINGSEDQTHLWLEYIEGTTSTDLDQHMLEKAAYALGTFQGKTHQNQGNLAAVLTNLSNESYAKNFYEHYRSWPVVYDYIRSDQTELPKHLCQMLIDFDNEASQHFEAIERLPRVLCHRDYWIANIFYQEEGIQGIQSIRAIDWDTAGWGYLGEDLASLIADEADNDHMVDYYRGLVKSYLKGFADETGISLENHHIFHLILAMFGYRLIEWFMMSPTQEQKDVHKLTLENLYLIKQQGQ